MPPSLSRRRAMGHVALGLGVLACQRSLGQPAERARYVGIETSAITGISQASFFGASGARVGRVALDFRAHGMAEHAQHVVVFPRRPGTRFALMNRNTLEVVAVVAAPVGRHFYGHGAFTRDGRTLLVTENDLETLQGGIGVYDVGAQMRRSGHLALSGAGPHEIARHPQRDLFYVALGGLETHPDYGRMPLNLRTFRSQVLALDFAKVSLDPLGHWPGSEGISLRHLAMDAAGRLYVGGQLVDPERAQSRDVLWLIASGDAAPLHDDGALHGYVSSVAADGTGALVTSKESGRCLHYAGSRLVDERRVEGASAAALGPGVSALSGYRLLDLNKTETAPLSDHEFDNHGLALPV